MKMNVWILYKKRLIKTTNNTHIVTQINLFIITLFTKLFTHPFHNSFLLIPHVTMKVKRLNTLF